MVYITISSVITLPVRDFCHCLRSAKTKMADASKPDDVARCLNSLTLLNMRNIASDDVLSELVNDYFVTRPITNDDDDSDLSETELTEEESDPEGSGPARPGVTDTDSATVTTDDDDGAAFAGAIENLADEIMPRGNGDTTETEPECQLTCKCKLYDGQPCHGRFSVDELANVRLQFLGMTHDELDIAILAKLSCGMDLSSLTTSSRKGQQNVRKAQRTDFFYHGFRVYTKKTVYTQYCCAVDAASTRKVSQRTFRRLWQQLLPFVTTMRPAGVTKLARSVNLPDSEKSAAVRDYEEHLRQATTERSHYTDL